MSQNKVTFGLRKVHIAFHNDSGPAKPSWEAPQPSPGAVRWTPEAQGDSTPFYADDTTYYLVESNNGYTGELELANIPDNIKARILGWEIDANGMLVEVADAKPEKFAMMGEVQGDQRSRRFVYYDCQASRQAKERTTKGESIEPTTDVINLTISPIEINNRMVVQGEMELNDTNTAAYNAFFDAVTIPSFGATNKSTLASTIAIANSLEGSLYTADSWASLEAVLASATAIDENVDAAQNQVDAATRALQGAINGLVVL